ncbi:tetratricopeptide repeat protein [Pedobacter africanus]|uniref:Tetratricopeptide repeat-containing protein n=1 Tax=Pedobacter africanus TaxID=151894 RepID=A0A1W1ZXL8_9SPHI|nr:tetratricopeptide repeat protein [Pedobacter africanus]SMC53096.1 Tetratricopeptide repeat-containing protein [Pedobacter africanus]
MVDLEYLHSLYNNNDHEACLDAVNLFLLVNDKNTEALLLKAKCEYQAAFNEGLNEEEEENENMLEPAYNSFKMVLDLDPSNEEAMLYLAYINTFLTRANLAESIAYCDVLSKSADLATRIKAISYRMEACSMRGAIAQALEDADSLIGLTRDFYKDNRTALEYELGQIYMKKADLYLEHQQDEKKAMGAFTEALGYLYPDPLTYNTIARLAFDNQEYELGGKAATMALLENNADSDSELMALQKRLEELSSKGIENKPLAEARFVAFRIFAPELDFDTVEMLNFAQQYIKLYPDWYIPYHYAGAALYDAKSYAEGLPYLEKSLQLGGRAFGLQRYFESVYRVKGSLPEPEKWPDDAAADYYNAGVNFAEFEAEVYTPEIGGELLKIRTEFYKKSYDGFYDLFYNNKQRKGPYDTDPHIFAMCCNNYGIALSAQGQLEQAVEVHRLGYSLSPFWEQLSSWGTALKRLGRYEEALDVLNTAVAYGGDYLSFSSYIELKGEILEVLFKLDRVEETKALLSTTDQEYHTFIKENRAELTEEELFLLNERYITVQNIRLDLLKEGSLEEANKAWQEQLDKHPDDNSSWFMLMQNFYQMKDYRQCIACADNYQSIKGKAMQLDSIQKVHFMRGMSYLYLENYDKAKENLIILLQSCKLGTEAEDSIISDANLRLAECCARQGLWKHCMAFAWKAIDCYNKNGWSWDEARVQMTLYYADACHAIGETKVAIATLNTILEVYPRNQDALTRKKEWKPKGLFSFFK